MEVKVDLCSKGLTATDLKLILQQLASPLPARVPRPRKCRKLEGAQGIRANMPPSWRNDTDLFLNNNPFGDAGIHHMVSLLPSSVHTWAFPNVASDLLELYPFANLLSGRKKATRFHLLCECNVIGDEGDAALARVIRQNKTLATLCINKRGNDQRFISNEGCNELVFAVCENNSMKLLLFQGPNFTFDRFLRIVKENTSRVFFFALVRWRFIAKRSRHPSFCTQVS